MGARGALLAWILAAAAGCSGDDGEGRPPAGEPHTFALLHASRLELGGSAESDPFLLGARVVRYDGIDRTTVSEVLEMNAFNADDVAIDQCGDPITAATLDDIGGIETGAYVELVDVGPITARSGETSERLDTRSFPQLLSVVAGVVYVGDDTGSLTLAAGSEITFTAPGGGGVGPIEATATLPDPIGFLRVGGQDPALGPATLSRGTDLHVEWDAGTGSEEVRIELSWMQPAGTVVVTCRARDDGLFVVPADRTRDVPELGSGVNPRLTVARVRRAEVAAAGLDDGDLVLQQAIALPLTVQ